MDNNNQTVVDTSAQPQTTTEPVKTDADAPLLNYKEVVELRKQVRDLAKKLESSKPLEGKPTQADAGNNEVAQLRRELALRDSLSEHGITKKELRELVTSAAKSVNPDDIDDFVKRYATVLVPPAQTSQGIVASPPTGKPPAPVTNSGSPTVDAKVGIPADLFAMNAEQFKSLSGKEKRQLYDQYQRQSGVNRSPFMR